MNAVSYSSGRLHERHSFLRDALPISQDDSAPQDDLCRYGWRITMSRDQFDELGRKLDTATSRRQVLKGLAGRALAAAAGAGTLLRFRGAEASTAKLCCVYDCKSGTHF